jgi:hypothetical protein
MKDGLASLENCVRMWQVASIRALLPTKANATYSIKLQPD